jgi:hypothetical protein
MELTIEECEALGVIPIEDCESLDEFFEAVNTLVEAGRNDAAVDYIKAMGPLLYGALDDIVKAWAVMKAFSPAYDGLADDDGGTPYCTVQIEKAILRDMRAWMQGDLEQTDAAQ